MGEFIKNVLSISAKLIHHLTYEIVLAGYCLRLYLLSN